MKVGDLTTLAHVKQWLGVTETEVDVLLARMISACSAMILNYINRPWLAATQFTDIYNGYGQTFMQLKQWPVISLASLSFGGTVLTTPATGNPPTGGWVLPGSSAATVPGAQQQVVLFGYQFPKVIGGVTAIYTAGYQVAGEAHVVVSDGGMPTPHAYTTTDFTWLQDGGVVLQSTGVALTKVTGVPVTGQYSVDSDGVYQFAVAQVGATMLITYSFVPPDLEQAVWQSIGEQYSVKSRIGVKSKSLGGQETISYAITALSSYVKESLSSYRRVSMT